MVSPKAMDARSPNVIRYGVFVIFQGGVMSHSQSPILWSLLSTMNEDPALEHQGLCKGTTGACRQADILGGQAFGAESGEASRQLLLSG